MEEEEEEDKEGKEERVFMGVAGRMWSYTKYNTCAKYITRNSPK